MKRLDELLGDHDGLRVGVADVMVSMIEVKLFPKS